MFCLLHWPRYMSLSIATKVETCKKNLICTTIRHLYCSNQLTTILNRLRHSESYYFGIKLETAMAHSLVETSTYLTPQTVSGDFYDVFHSEWNKLNKILTNVTGSNVVNSAAGIMIQEVKSDNGSDSLEQTLPTAKRNKEWKLNIDAPSILALVTIYNWLGPSFTENALFSPPADNDFEFKKMHGRIWYMDLLQVRKIISFVTMLTCYDICFNINSFQQYDLI